MPGKRHISLRVDEDVLQFFKAMGVGHLSRMNAVLLAFMQARLAGVLEGPEDSVEAKMLAVLEALVRERDAYDRDQPTDVARCT